MIVPSITIETHVSKDENVFKHLYFDATTSTLVAVDGFVLVEIPVRASPKDKTGWVPVLAVQVARMVGSNEITLNPKKIHIIGTAIKIDRPQKKLTKEKGTQFDEIRSLTDKPQGLTISLDVELLYKVASTIYANGNEQKPITLYYRKSDDPIIVDNLTHAQAAIMPMGTHKSD